MDFIVRFFRDTLDGGLYYVVVLVCLILIMAIIGFIMEKAKLAKEEAEKTVVIADSNCNPVENQEVISNKNAATNVSSNVVITDEVIEQGSTPTKEDGFIDFGSTSNVSNLKSVDSSVVGQSGVQQNVQPPVQNEIGDQAIPVIDISTNATSTVNTSTNINGVTNQDILEPTTQQVIDTNQHTVVIPPIVQAVSTNEDIPQL